MSLLVSSSGIRLKQPMSSEFHNMGPIKPKGVSVGPEKGSDRGGESHRCWKLGRA